MNKQVVHTYEVDGTISRIVTSSGALSTLGAELEPYDPANVLFVIDSLVARLHKAKVEQMLDALPFETEVLTVDGGESGKTLAGIERILEWAVPHATRDSVLCALGGGAIGNTVGTAASLLYRGTRFFHVPTTLMAQADGAIGIKQAVNAAKSKNAFGAYHVPLFVLNDITFCRTLSRRQMCNGLSETVKAFVARRPELSLKLLDDSHDQDPFNLSSETLVKLITETAWAKAECLVLDPRERNDLLFLELGHTVGHALERSAGSTLHHGEAIALGMRIECEYARRLGVLEDPDVADILDSLLVRWLAHPDDVPAEIPLDSVMDRIRHDNRRTRLGPTMVLPAALGRTRTVHGVDEQLLLQTLEGFGGRAS